MAGGAGEPPTPVLARAVLEMRESIGVDAARRCATRADPAQRQAIAVLARAAAAAIGTAADADLDAAYAELWRALVAGSQNIAYRLALNSLVAALDVHAHIADALRPGDPAALEALGAAIEAGQADAAGTAARGLLEHDAEHFA